MKKLYFLLLMVGLIGVISCKRENWADGKPSPVIFLGDIRSLYKGSQVSLNTNNMLGASQITGIVISDAVSGNAPQGTIVLQNTLRKKTRGINIIVGQTATDYMPGDSLIIDVSGGILSREGGSLQISQITTDAIKLVSKDNVVTPARITAQQLIENPDTYESTLVRIYAGTVIPEPAATETYSGDKAFSDGSDTVILHTEVNADFASEILPATATFTGIPLFYNDGSNNNLIKLWPRHISDMLLNSSLLSWNLFGAKGNELTASSTSTNTNLEISVLSRGPGIVAQAAGSSYASTFPINADRAAAEAAGSYYQFTVKVKSSAVVSLSALDVILRIQTSAPRTYIWEYSLDNGDTFKDVGVPYTWTTGFSDNNGIQQPTIDLSTIADLQNISADTSLIFRLYAWGGTSATSNSGFRIGKSLTAAQSSLTVSGSVTTN
ncbi:hypothetical protein FW774_19460 [Pedobacter sp. BS3]|uniref:DUF5689 domain-containing protein n=1 Tax=Pedobacter sp. BS3 TaxID=2567937 RepID=UPI0011EE5ECF|nr:DUF5689 domain-containing protein [Pedobacter sp. BS3]TZF81113.1 hypothetical protein FW774_19460 [Pedobacter sp. BS3]